MNYLIKENLILGCGNPLFGDDGFGPEFVRKIKNEKIEDKFNNLAVIDCGSTISPFLNLINSSKHKIKNLYIIDCGDFKGKVGDLLILDGKEIAPQDFVKSSHCMNVPHEINRFSSNVKLILVQGNVDPNSMGLEMNEEVRNAIDKVQNIIISFMEGVQ
ncbi:MAG: hydrogenase maturation protease [Methanofastidiosum sp.]|jgi:coenzyme F420 hydrogenase subunit delta|nr:hydrogenase maturation protease [Methanofastidiosum sp.]